MGFFQDIFGDGLPPIPKEQRQEVESLIKELIQIGKRDDFLSERPGGQFNAQCHHVRARAIGKRLNEIGGLPLMEAAHKRVRKKLGMNLTSHLDYAWSEIGKWIP
ncbi:MAG TPA: hypothetical protein VMT46_17260 [Anaerolineaceae bacterium]|nr:hypothetical protein [Anaerolineaceae bacterium]